MKYSIKTLGCKANLYDSQILENQLRQKGWVAADNDKAADICIINSCTVTDEAERQSKKWITKFQKIKPGARIVFTGCSAEVDPMAVPRNGGLTQVVSNRDKHLLSDLVMGSNPNDSFLLGSAVGYDEFLSKHPMDREWPQPESVFMNPKKNFEDGSLGQILRTRTFLKIQEGCNSFCTYCIIPYGRGPSRSLGITNVLSQINQLVEMGIKEIILTGINIGEYGIDLESRPSLEILLEHILEDTSVQRLRLSSLDPKEITPKILDLMRRNSRLCPHFHVSLQSVHSSILRLMKRKYDSTDVVTCLNELSKMPCKPFVGMDLITGFPGETDKIFEESFAILSHLPWSRLHVFPFSERKGTPATKLKGKVPDVVKKERATRLRDLSIARLSEHYYRVLKQNDVIHEVLVEGETKGPAEFPHLKWIGGYTPDYLRVIFKVADPKLLNNKRVSLKIESVYKNPVQGDVAFIGHVLN